MAQTWTREEFGRSLETRLDELMRGQIHLEDLPSAVSAWFFAGEAYGRASRQPEIEQLERDVNRLYNLAFTTPQQRRDELDRKLSQALDSADEATWLRIEADLRAMRGPTNEYRGVTPNNDSISAAQTVREEPQWQQQQSSISGPPDPNSVQSAHGRKRAA